MLTRTHTRTYALLNAWARADVDASQGGDGTGRTG
jgi:hypothetical protein